MAGCVTLAGPHGGGRGNVVLFTDAEEVGLLGALGFVKQHL
jgi:hypothetical protein